MSENWKPGDVAMVNDCTRPDAPWKLATCTAARTPERETTWRLHDTGGEVWSSVSDARRLVVIDPEDREQVKRLCATIPDIHWYGTPGLMQAALREFANPTPPKPEEPTGLGAVVEDAEGVRWVLVTGDDAFPWAKVPAGESLIECFAWHEFSAAHVIHEGVTP